MSSFHQTKRDLTQMKKSLERAQIMVKNAEQMVQSAYREGVYVAQAEATLQATKTTLKEVEDMMKYMQSNFDRLKAARHVTWSSTLEQTSTFV